MLMQPKFENELSKKVYDILENPSTTDLGAALSNQNLRVEDDMILLEVGEKLIGEKKMDKAFVLYKYYTKTFPNIVVAWNDLGDVYLALNNKNEAINCYQQALKIRPQNQRAKEALSKLVK